MIRVYKESPLFFNLAMVFAVIGAIILGSTSKGDVELWVNQFHDPALNVFFYYITYLGDGLFSVLVVLGLFLRRIYYGILSIIAFLSTSLVTQVLKRVVFDDFVRPYKFFDPSLKLKFVEGLEIHSYFSFPSGHTSSAFSVFLLLSLLSKRTSGQIVCFMLALATAFSRVYLLQHFFMDIYAGALIGVVVTAFVYSLIQYHTRWSENEILNRPVYRLGR